MELMVGVGAFFIVFVAGALLGVFIMARGPVVKDDSARVSSGRVVFLVREDAIYDRSELRKELGHCVYLRPGIPLNEAVVPVYLPSEGHDAKD